MMAALGRRIGIYAIDDVRAIHWRWSGNRGGDIRWLSRWFRRRRRFGRTGANKRIRWNIAHLRFGIEDQTGWTIQFATFTTDAAVEYVRAFGSVVTIAETTAIEIDRW